MKTPAPLIVDFAPHDVRYAGAFEGRWFASLVHYPSLLALDESGKLLERIECPNVGVVVDGRFAIGSGPPRGPHRLICHDVPSGKQLWLRESASLAHVMGSTAIVRMGTGIALVELATGGVLWEIAEPLDVHAHDERNVYVEDRAGVVRAIRRETGDLAWTREPEKPRVGVATAWPAGLAPSGDAVWYVGGTSRVLGLSAETGAPIAEHVWSDAVRRLVAAGKAVLAAHDHGIAIVRDGAISSFVEDLENPLVEAHAEGFVAWNGNVLAWGSGFERAPVRIALEENDRGGPGRRYDWESFRLAPHDAVLVARTRLLRIPLGVDPGARLAAAVTAPSLGELSLEKGTVFFAGDARVLVEHASRGRFWFDVAESGLAKGDAVEIGGFRSKEPFVPEPVATTLVRDGRALVPPPPPPAVVTPVDVGRRVERTPREKTRIPEALTSTIDVLVEHGFIEPLTDAALAALAEGGATTAADILSAVHENATGIRRGVVVHDHRFGNETEDVVAELSATLADEPISFAQVGKREDALQIRAGEVVQWVSFVPGGLPAIVAWLNRRLEEAGAQRRIFELDTDADYHCYLVTSPSVIAAMQGQGVVTSSR